MGFAEGPIHRSQIKTYGQDEFGLSGDELEFFVTVLSKTDAGYLSPTVPSRTDGKVIDVVDKNDVAGVKGLLARLAAPSGAGDRFRKRSGRQRARK